MIKLIPCPKITKRELMAALMEGRRFTLEPEFVHLQQNVIHWDDNHGNSPVRSGTEPWIWRGFKFMHEITEFHWYDNIPSEGVLCWVWNDLGSSNQVAQIVISYHSGYTPTFKTFIENWNHATPILPSECYQEPV